MPGRFNSTKGWFCSGLSVWYPLTVLRTMAVSQSLPVSRATNSPLAWAL